MGIFCIRGSARVLNILESGFLEDPLASEKEKGRGEGQDYEGTREKG